MLRTDCHSVGDKLNIVTDVGANWRLSKVRRMGAALRRSDDCGLVLGQQHAEIARRKLHPPQRFAEFASFHEPGNVGGELLRQHDPDAVFAASLTPREPPHEEHECVGVLGDHQIKAMRADDSEIGIQHAPAITLDVEPSKLWRKSAFHTRLHSANRAIVDALISHPFLVKGVTKRSSLAVGAIILSRWRVDRLFSAGGRAVHRVRRTVANLGGRKEAASRGCNHGHSPIVRARGR